MKYTKRNILALGTLCLALGGCLSAPEVRPTAPDTLVIEQDGTMHLNNRLVPDEDVIIYGDGFGGEKAAVRVRMEPLHPDFFRDHIVVVRE